MTQDMWKLERWREKLKGKRIWSIPTFLEEKGFKKLHGRNSGGFQYVNDSGVVIKYSYLSGRKPKRGIPPTIVRRRNPYTGFSLVIQVYCNRPGYVRQEQLEELTDITKSADVILRNVGYYKDKLVAFDW